VNILVTGGAGYIGSITATALLDKGHGVVVVDDLSTGHRAAVPGAASFVQADIADTGTVLRAIEEHSIDAVMHFAAASLVGESMRDPIGYYRNNVSGSVALLDAVLAGGVKRFVLSSTAALFGTPDDVPIPESAAIRPESVYGETKHSIERLLGWLATTKGLGYTALRYFNAAGASELQGEDHDPETHLIPIVLQVAEGSRPSVGVYGNDYPTPDGSAVRDYVHVVDLADAHVLAVECIEPGSQRAYNLGSGTGFSVRQVIDTCRAVTGRAIPEVASPRRAGDPPILVADSSKARAELGWRPRTESLEAIVESAWRWRLAHPHGYPRPGRQAAWASGPVAKL
jgi:UDP-glucose 4-epimerase